MVCHLSLASEVPLSAVHAMSLSLTAVQHEVSDTVWVFQWN